MKEYALFLDDIRMPRDCSTYMGAVSFYLETDFVIVRNFEDFCHTIEAKFKDGEWPSIISFDHDLADEHYDPAMYRGTEEYGKIAENFKEKTGMDCAKWLIDFCMDNSMNLPDYIVHSMNPSGAKNIHSILHNFKNFQNGTPGKTA